MTAKGSGYVVWPARWTKVAVMSRNAAIAWGLPPVLT